jgi:ATP-dependent Zn protease
MPLKRMFTQYCSNACRQKAYRLRKKWSVPFHEAAHFVVSYSLSPGTYRGQVTIEPGEGYLGRAHVEESWNEEMARNEILVCLAGPAADDLMFDNPHPRASAGDTARARELLTQLGETEEEWRAKARELVVDFRGIIQALADELMERKTLDADEAEIIVDIARGAEGTTPETLEDFRARKAHKDPP